VSADDDLLRALAVLREQYIAEAPGRIEALRAALEQTARGEGAALTELRQLLHRLAGSGGAYGLHAVSDAARAGELAIRAMVEGEVPPSADDCRILAQHVDAVAAAFRDAGARV
jgi:chemotaxis protein histidine kinase CheA